MNALTAAPEPAMLGFLQRAIADPSFDVNKFEVVLKAVREEQAKQAERQFYAALAEAQGEMEPIRKSATNPHTRSKYATFEAIDGMIRPIYTKHGFSVGYRSGKTDSPGTIRVICTVAHAAGHAVEGELTAALDSSGSGGRTNKTDVQAVGSTVSYLRRYLLSMMFNVALAGDDDDGEGMRRQPAPQPPPPPRNERPAPAPPRRQASPRPPPTLDETLGGDDIPKDWPTTPRDEPLPRMLQEIETMDMIRIETIGEDEQWMADVRELFPPDRDRLREAMRARIDELRGGAQ